MWVQMDRAARNSFGGDLTELLFDATGCLANSEWTGWLGGSAADRDGTNKLRQGKCLMFGLTLD